MDSLGADSVLRMISFADVSKNLNSGAGFNFRNESYGQIYSILKQCGQHDFLRFSDSSTDLSYTFALKEAPLFHSCGIYFQSRSTSSLVYYDVKARCYLLILKKEDLVNEATLQKKVDEFCAEYEISNARKIYVAIEHGYFTEESAIEDAYTLRKVLPTNMVFNRFFDIKVETKKYALRYSGSAKASYYNLANLFREISVDTGDIDLDVQNAKKVFDAVLQKKEEKVIFYYDFGDEKEVTSNGNVVRVSPKGAVVHALAAYCAVVFGMKFEFNAFGDLEMFHCYRKLISRNYNYLSDYLKFIANPIDCGFRLFDDRIYIYRKDFLALKKNPQKYAVRLQIRGIPFNMETKTLVGKEAFVSEEFLSNLRIVPLQEVFQLNDPDWDVALKNMKELNKVMLEAEKIFIRGGIYEEPLNFTNTVIVQYGNYVYFTWVDKIFGKVPYQAYVYPTGSIVFQDELSLYDLEGLYDFNLVVDGPRILKKLVKAGMVSRENVSYKLPKTASGVIVNGLKANPNRAEKNCNMSIAELGIWYPVTTQFRGGKNAEILKCATNTMARRKFLLTCFGGPHNAIGTTISLVDTIV